jgi:hypothetical protein
MTTFHIDLDIDDPETLYQAALERLLQENVDEDDAKRTLRPEGVINDSACLVMLLDPGSLPGCSINQSWVDPV